MWLINANNQSLEEFVGNQIPAYNILSHTWGHEEVSFQDMKSGRASSKPAYHKIIECCRLSLQPQKGQRKCGWVWIDSCCIDKSSSAQLSEAINSMYNYYRDASTCFVYFADMAKVTGDIELEDLRHCRWFTRSWTLQELIAPKRVAFFDKEWEFLGLKSDHLVAISAITGIDMSALQDSEDLSSFSIAKKMSWAAGRQATREEDIAYALLGLFGVNLPLLYGEGPKAFIRLQEEIMKQSDDQSLFAWGEPHFLRPQDLDFGSSEGLGFLAESPEDFRMSSKVVSFVTEQDHIWTMTNKGIQVNFPTLRRGLYTLFVLNCHLSTDFTKRLAISSMTALGNIRTRAPRGLLLIDEETFDTAKYENQYFWVKDNANVRTQRCHTNSLFIKPQDHYIIVGAEPAERWNSESQVFVPPTNDVRWWQVGIWIKLREPFVESHEALEFFIRVHLQGPMVWCNVMKAILRGVPRRWEGPASLQDQRKDRESSSTISFDEVTVWLSEHRVFKVIVRWKHVVGQPMFVVDITEPQMQSVGEAARSGARVIK